MDLAREAVHDNGSQQSGCHNITLICSGIYLGTKNKRLESLLGKRYLSVVLNILTLVYFFKSFLTMSADIV